MNRIHHEFVDLPVNEQMLSTVLSIHGVLVELLALSGLVERRLLVVLVWLGSDD